MAERSAAVGGPCFRRGKVSAQGSVDRGTRGQTARKRRASGGTGGGKKRMPRRCAGPKNRPGALPDGNCAQLRRRLKRGGPGGGAAPQGRAPEWFSSQKRRAGGRPRRCRARPPGLSRAARSREAVMTRAERSEARVAFGSVGCVALFGRGWWFGFGAVSWCGAGWCVALGSCFGGGWVRGARWWRGRRAVRVVLYTTLSGPGLV